jgi:hypothetical protein
MQITACIQRVSALGCREVGFYCDTWGKHFSQLILPKNLDQSRQFRRIQAYGRRERTGIE